VTLRGRGSITAESSEPLHIYVSAATPTDLASARNLAQVRPLARWPVGKLAYLPCWHIYHTALSCLWCPSLCCHGAMPPLHA
jgi:hypothetical protein